MNFYTAAHKHYCGVDLHARSMYVCILSQQGVVLLHRNLPCDAPKFLAAIQPYREDLVVAVECIYRAPLPFPWVERTYGGGMS